MLAVWVGADQMIIDLLSGAGIPNYPTEDDAVRGFMHLVRHREVVEALAQVPPAMPNEFAPDIDAARQIENLAIASGAHGRPGELRFDPANDGSIVFAFGAGPTAGSSLLDAIPRRQSTRTEYDGRSVGGADLQAVATAAAIPGVDLVLITDRPRMERVRDPVVAGNSAQMADAAFVQELKTWLRFSPRQAIGAR